jgi:hypothetical protein
MVPQHNAIMMLQAASSIVRQPLLFLNLSQQSRAIVNVLLPLCGLALFAGAAA